jgi:tRNA dimethylallyltransferase
VSTARLLIVVGPTGAGKTDLALALARELNGEVVSADSQQVYRNMDIGTGKVSQAQRQQVRHHLIDVADPDDEMTAVRFMELADSAIADVSLRGKTVIVCGGTGLYVRTLLLGVFEGPAADAVLRAQLYQRIASEGAAVLHGELQTCDPICALRIDVNDHKRLVRALEVYTLTGIPMSKHQAAHNHRELPSRYPHTLIGLSPEREQLYSNIDLRVCSMFDQGLVAEVASLRARGFVPPLRSQQAIGYAEIHAHFDGVHDLDTARMLVQRNSRRYARRQLSWYRPDSAVQWHQTAASVDVGALNRFLCG